MKFNHMTLKALTLAKELLADIGSEEEKLVFFGGMPLEGCITLVDMPHIMCIDITHLGSVSDGGRQTLRATWWGQEEDSCE